jgi:hypothetical protein
MEREGGKFARKKLETLTAETLRALRKTGARRVARPARYCMGARFKLRTYATRA